MKQKRLIGNALLLTATGFVLRGLGMVVRVYISSKIGEEGMGLYQLVQSVYFLFITLAQSGISVALTRCMSSHLAKGDTVLAYSSLKSALNLSFFIGSFAGALMCALARPVCIYWLGDMRCVNALITLSVSLPFIAVCNVLSSYFIIRANAVYGCTAQLLEQGIRIFIIMLSGVIFKPKTLSESLSAIVFASSVSEAVSCAFLYICYVIKRPKLKRVKQYRPIIKNAVPVALSRYLASALHTVENVLVPNAIAMYTHSKSEALSQFGALKGMALPLLFFPYSFLSAITTLLVPRVSGAEAVGNKKSLADTTNKICSITLLLSFAAAGLFLTFSEYIGMLVYKSERVCAIIMMLAPIVPFMYLDSVCDGFLKGLGKQKQVLYHNCIDSGARIILVLVFVPRFGLGGFIGVMVVSNISIALMNFFTLCRATNIKFSFFCRFFWPAGITFASAFLTKLFIKNGATTLKTVVGSALYCGIFALLYAVFNYFKKIYKNSALF